MFNTTLLNILPLNTVEFSGDNSKENLNFYILYNDFYLCDQEKTFATIKYLDSKAISYEKVNYNLNFGNFYNFQEGEKQILVIGSIRVNSREELIETIQEMKSKLLNQNQDLIIKDGNKKRRVRAACSNIFFDENHYNTSWIKYEVTFLTYDYLEDYLVTSEFFNTSNNNFNFNIINQGTAQSKFYLALSIKSGESIDLNINIGGNNISINGSLFSGDIIILDGYKGKITKNGNLVNFEGEILPLEVGGNSVIINTNGVIDLDIVYFTNFSYK